MLHRILIVDFLVSLYGRHHLFFGCHLDITFCTSFIALTLLVATGCHWLSLAVTCCYLLSLTVTCCYLLLLATTGLRACTFGKLSCPGEKTIIPSKSVIFLMLALIVLVSFAAYYRYATLHHAEVYEVGNKTLFVIFFLPNHLFSIDAIFLFISVCLCLSAHIVCLL